MLILWIVYNANHRCNNGKVLNDYNNLLAEKNTRLLLQIISENNLYELGGT